jgi:signal transduction histidine kinase/DNA-binding response OmpR family regulator
MSIYEDDQGVIWVGTKYGLNRITFVSPNSGGQKRQAIIKSFTAENGIPDSPIVGILGDHNGFLWLSTEDGVARFDPGSETTISFDVLDGLQGNKFSTGSHYEAHDGRMYFGGTNGLTAFFPDQVNIDARDRTPPIVLTNFLLANVPVSLQSEDPDSPLERQVNNTELIELRSDEAMFSIEFVELSYEPADAISYAYRLSGINADWIFTNQSNRRATYSGLPPGDYGFQVARVGDSGILADEAATVRLILHPPLWQTWWAYTLYVAAAILAIALLVRTRTVSLMKRARYLISHEFRTPLTLILGPVERLLKVQSNADVASRLRVVKENGQRLLRLVDQLLNLSRLSAAEPVTHSPQPLGGIASSIVESFQPLASERGLRLELEEHNNLWVRCAPDSLEKILLNLISNAIKYTPQGGHVSVSIVADEDDVVRLSVSDTGIGISPDEHDAVFDRFYRARGNGGEANPGAGLGLALVKELAEAAGGSVELTSQLVQGTTVAVLLPRHHVGPEEQPAPGPAEVSQYVELELASSKQAPPVAAIDRPDGADGRPSILIIEDNADMQDYIAELLVGTYDVEAVADGESGIRIAVEQVPDVVICDVMLPSIDGFEVSKALKSDDATSHVPIVMLTGRGDHDSRLKGLRQHVDDYLTKPFDDEELMLRIENLLSAKERFKQRYSRLSYDDIELAGDPRPRENRFLGKLQTIVEANYSDHEFRVEQLASAMAMSDRQLQRKLNALANRSPSEYLRRYRLTKAKNMLREGMQVGLIAEAVGFSSQAYFSICFRRAFGCTPTEFRQQQDKRAI